MTKQNLYLATTLFLGGFIPLKDTLSNQTAIQYCIYAQKNQSINYVKCNQIKKEMLEKYEQIRDYSFSKTDQKLKENVDNFKIDGVKLVIYQNYCLSLYLEEKEQTRCLMKGILLEYNQEQEIDKSYFFEELFR